MPRYDYRCNQSHTQELRRGIDITTVECGKCGGTATRQSVYPIATTHPRFWGSDFEFTPGLQAMHDEVMGYKHEAVAALQEEQANGFARKGVK